MIHIIKFVVLVVLAVPVGVFAIMALGFLWLITWKDKYLVLADNLAEYVLDDFFENAD